VVCVTTGLYIHGISLLTTVDGTIEVGGKSCQKLFIDFTYLQVALYSFLSVLLCIVMSRLFTAIGKMPQMDLAEEKRHLKIMFLCFELSFVTQSVFLWADSCVLNNASLGKIPYMCVNLLLPVLLDGTSIFVIILLHRYAYNPHQMRRRGSAAIS
jgi:hypothetical protein